MNKDGRIRYVDVCGKQVEVIRDAAPSELRELIELVREALPITEDWDSTVPNLDKLEYDHKGQSKTNFLRHWKDPQGSIWTWRGDLSTHGPVLFALGVCNGYRPPKPRKPVVHLATAKVVTRSRPRSER